MPRPRPVSLLLRALALAVALGLLLQPTVSHAATYPHLGERSAQVTRLQRMLVVVEALPARRVTGYFGRPTRHGVRVFQGREHLRTTGRVNGRTWRRLVRRSAPRAPSPAPAPAPPPLGPAPYVVAHRGAVVAGVGEETLPAMAYAADHGAGVLELDVQWTRDEQMIALHDLTLERTATCPDATVASTPVAQLTLAQVGTCTVSGAPVATVAEIVDLARSRHLGISPEIKVGVPEFTASRAAQLTRAIGDVPAYVQSFFPAQHFPLMRRSGYTGDLVYLSYKVAQLASASAVRATGATILAPCLYAGCSTPSAAAVAAYRAAGVHSWLWTASTAAELVRARALGVDGVVVDDAALAQGVYPPSP